MCNVISNKIFINLKNNISQECEQIKSIIKYVMPCMLSATIFLWLSEQALLQQRGGFVASKVMDVGFTLSVALGILNIITLADPNWNFMSSLKVDKVIIPKKELEEIKAEIVRLKQELDETNRKLNSCYVSQKNSNEKIAVAPALKKEKPEEDQDDNKVSEIDPDSITSKLNKT